MKVLFACSEAYPFIKTGGLGDVAGSLPRALTQNGCQVRVLLPAYASVLEIARETGVKNLGEFQVDGELFTLWQTRLPGSRVVVWLVDIPAFSERAGNPYTDATGRDWPDNAQRFYVFCKAAAAIACGELKLHWRADIVHCHDWQSGLIPALLKDRPHSPASVFTIHNLAYRGIFDKATFIQLGLPWHWWHMDAMEFYDQFSFLKGGIAAADAITTVSPSYAEEIQTPAFGCGFEGILQRRSDKLSGIVNGIDTEVWNPGSDPYLVERYNRRTLSRKVANKLALQKYFKLPVDHDIPLLGFIGRLVEQKGVDLIVQALPSLIERHAFQFVALGSGEPHLQQALLELADKFPEQMAIQIGYSEALSHQIEAGSDIFLMPSRFEPCGLNQLYSQRYGTIPVAHYVGGLRDTIVHFSHSEAEKISMSSSAISAMDETGFLFTEATTTNLANALDRALVCFTNKKLWRKLQLNGMGQDFSWATSAAHYMRLYQSLV
ncbi:MAG TPA: glycogen synthase GlgA [Cellvibrionaceae bacterium]